VNVKKRMLLVPVNIFVMMQTKFSIPLKYLVTSVTTLFSTLFLTLTRLLGEIHIIFITLYETHFYNVRVTLISSNKTMIVKRKGNANRCPTHWLRILKTEVITKKVFFYTFYGLIIQFSMQ